MVKIKDKSLTIKTNSLSSPSLTNGLVAYYKFNDDVSDYSGNNNHGTYYGRKVYATGKKLDANGAVDLNGSSDYIVVPNSASLNPTSGITVSAWVKPTRNFIGSGNDVIIDKAYTSHTPPYYQYHMGICGDYCSGQYFTFSCSINGVSYGKYSPPFQWVPNNWYHVVGSYDGNMIRLYINGKCIDSVAVQGAINTYNTELYMGKFRNANYYTPIDIDEARIYNRALSNQEITMLYQTTPRSLPAAPNGLSAKVVASNQINLIWNDISDNEDGFKIEQKTGTGDFTEIGSVGANITNYTVTNLNPDINYTFRIRSYNGEGNSGYSGEANIFIPQIIWQPSSIIGCENSYTLFNVEASGSGMTYQWKKDGVDIPGATGSSYIINNVQTSDAGVYTVKVLWPDGYSTTSNSAVLTLSEGPHIQLQPKDITTCEGIDATFSVSATGTDLWYQWQENINNSWTDVANATNPSYTFNASSVANGHKYQCVVNGDCGAVNSDTVTLNVNPIPKSRLLWEKKNDLPNQVIYSGYENCNFNHSFSNEENGFNFYNDESSPVYFSVYNPKQDSWSTIDPCPEGLNYFLTSYFAIEKNIYVNDNSSHHLWEYDISSKTWTRKKDDPGIASNKAGFSIGSKIYMCFDRDESSLYLWEYDPSVDNWTRKANFVPVTFNQDIPLYGVSINNKGYIFDSWNGLLIEYNPTTDQWSQKSNFPVSLGRAAIAFPFLNKLEVAFDNETDYSNSIWEYNPETNQWLAKYSYPGKGREACVAFSIGNKMYFGGGEGINFNDFWASSPDSSIISGISTVCPGQMGVSYNVPAVENATGYKWTLPEGAVIASGDNTNTISVNFPDNFTNGILSVYGFNNCGNGSPSVNFPVTINSPTKVNTQPSSQTICEGSNALFQIGATGTNLTYQWQQSDDDGNAWVNIDGEESAVLNLNNVDISLDGTKYRCIVNGTCGSVTGDAAELSVTPKTKIVADPAGIAVCEGTPVSFKVFASGSDLTYQWQENSTGTWAAISGATEAIYNLNGTSANNGHSYRCVVTGTCEQAISNEALLTVGPQIIVQPEDQEVCTGQSVTFGTVSAMGPAPFTYQWQQSTDNGATWNNITNATNPRYSTNVTAQMSSYLYRCIVTGSCGTPAASRAAKLTIPYTAVDTPLADLVVCDESIGSFSIDAAGSGLTYHWQQSTDNGTTWNNLEAESFNSYTFEANASMNGSRYRCLVNGSCGSPVTSNSALLTVNPIPQITTQPADQTICQGQVTGLSVSADGSDLNYQWQVNNSVWQDINNATSSIYAVASDTSMNGKQYRCVVNGLCDAYSDNATLTVYATTQITVQPKSVTACEGSTAGFWVQAIGGDLSYQWQQSTDGGITWNDINDATESDYSAQAVSQVSGYLYRCKVNGSCGAAVTSSAASLTISSDPKILAQPADQTVTEDNPAVLGVQASGSNLTYQWQNDFEGDWSDIPGANSANYNITASESVAGDYRCVLNGTCTSDMATLNVLLKPKIITQPADQEECRNNPVIFTISANGANLTYQWQKDTDGSWTDIAGANSQVYELSASESAIGDYRCIINDADDISATSSAAKFSLTAEPQITEQPKSLSVCDGDEASFAITVTGANLDYQWEQSTDGGSTWENIEAAKTSHLTFTVSNHLNGYNYCCKVSGNCDKTVTSETVQLSVVPNVLITSQPIGQAACEGTSVSFSTGATGNELTYQWQTKTSSQWMDISGATDSTYSTIISSANHGTMYRCNVGGTCGTAISRDALLTEGPQITTQPVDQKVCDGSIATFGNITATGVGPFTYLWQQSSDQGNTWSDMQGAIAAYLNVNANFAKDGYMYRCQVNGSCGLPATSIAAGLSIHPPTSVTLNPSDQATCEGNTVAFEVNASGDGLIYQWEQSLDNASWQEISGSASRLELPATYAMNNYHFRCKVKGICDAQWLYSGSAILSVSGNTVSPLVASVTNVMCESNNTGGAVLLSTPTSNWMPVTYTWSNGSVQQNLSSVGTGTYSVTVTDNKGCKRSLTNTVGFDNAITSKISVTDVDLAGSSTGTIDPGLTGGHIPLSYNWSNGATTEVISGLAAGTYSLTITDSKQCSKSLTAKVAEPEAIVYLSAKQVKSESEPSTHEASLPVGTITGNAGVSPTGAATYEIPIDVVPGLQSMEPKISIVYNSQAGNGLLGWGVNLSGISAITRVPQTIYSNGSAKGVVDSTTDNYALDGNRLLFVPEAGLTYGADGSHYHTENETFSIVTAHGNYEGTGPEWFEVKAKDGTIYKYGKATGRLSIEYNSLIERPKTPQQKTVKAIYSWNLDTVTDIYGNYMAYTYEQNDLYSYLKKITYGSNQSIPAVNNNSVEFTYAPREDSVPVHYGYQNGALKFALSKIEVKSAYATFKSYRFDYTKDDFSRLFKITESNGDGESLNPTVFDWGDYRTTPIDTLNTNVQLPKDKKFADQTYISLDVNGDGLTDLIGLYGDNYRDIRVYYAVRSPNGKISFTTSANPVDLVKSITPSTGENSYITNNFGADHYGDLDGDNVKEIILSGTNSKNEVVFCTYKDGVISKIKTNSLKSNSAMPVYVIGDINNDGEDEIIYIENGTGSNAGKHPGGIYFPGNDTWKSFNLGTLSNITGLYLSDFDGDGLQDLMLLTGNESYFYKNTGGVGTFTTTPHWRQSGLNSNYLMRMGDFNGDGLPDFILRKYGTANGEWSLALNNGKFGFTIKPLPGITSRDDKDTNKDDDKDNVLVTDFDNDGKSDLIVCDATYDNWKHSWGSKWKEFTGFITYWYKSTGTDFTCVKSAKSSNEADAYAKYYITGDFNGDGRMDVMNYGYNCYNGPVQGTDGNQCKWRMYDVSDPTHESGMVTGIINGLKQRTEFSYKPLTDSEVYAKDIVPAYPLSTFTAPMYVVNGIRTDNGKNAMDSTVYTYKNATIQLTGKGFLGFGKTTRKNKTFHTTSIVSSEFNSTYFSFDKQTNELWQGDTLTSRNTINYTYLPLGGKQVFSYPGLSESSDLLKNIVTKNAVEYDENGNLTGQHAYINDDFYISHKTFLPPFDCFGNPASVTTTVTRKGEPTKTQTQTFAYTKGKPIKSVLNGITTSYTYDSIGNVISVNTSATGLDDRKDSSVYDPSGRFVIKQYNALKQHTETLYDPNGFGWVTGSKDINGKITSIANDSWGRVISKTTPDNKIMSTEVKFVSDTLKGVPLYTCYFSEYHVTEADNSERFAGAEYFDRLGRSLRKVNVGFGSATYYTDTKYNDKGQVEEVTEPYQPSEGITKKTSYTYDNLGRTLTEKLPDGVIKSYQYNDLANQILTTYSTGETYTKKYDAVGKVSEASDPGGSITYAYTSTGKPRRIVSPGSTITIAYDAVTDLQDTLSDPDAGIIAYGYNTFGELTFQKDLRGKTTTMKYDVLGRVTQKTTGDTTVYTYDSPGAAGFVSKITSGNKAGISYTYDNLYRIQTETHTKGDLSFANRFTYDTRGRVSTYTYPNRFAISYTYNDNNDLLEIHDSVTNHLIWKLQDVNTKGQLTHARYGNNSVIAYGYDDNDRLNRISVPDMIDFNYQFNAKQQLDYRDEKYKVQGVWKGFREDFTYDGVNRLNSAVISGIPNPPPALNMTYNHAANDRLMHKSDAGDYTYQPDNHKIDELDAVDSYHPDADSIAYTAEGKVSAILEGKKALSFAYDINNQRFSMEYKQNDTLQYTRYYFDTFEKEVKRDGTSRFLNYIYAGNTLIGIYEQSNAVHAMHYVYSDHLGSLRCITDSAGNVEQCLGYDARVTAEIRLPDGKIPSFRQISSPHMVLQATNIWMGLDSSI